MKPELSEATESDYSSRLIRLMEERSAHNYSPLPVVLNRGEGAWVWDVEGNQYLDMLSAYSAVNFGHCNPRITSRAIEQINRLTLTSRAFFSEELSLCCAELADLCQQDKVLLMNSGAEAVETSFKAARRWAYRVKKVPENRAEIICFHGNFHGRTIAIISTSDSEIARADFGPFTPGFLLCPYGEISTLEKLISANTAAIMVEPIQGEGGIVSPPSGFLRQVRALCDEKRVLLINDEIQTGLCRTGEIFAADHEGITSDLLVIGKSLGGGIVPISAVAGTSEVMDLFDPGSHGSTFGGNPFACAIAREVIALIKDEQPHVRAEALGKRALTRLREVNSPYVKDVRGRGLLIGIEFTKKAGPAKNFSKKLLKRGILTKDTREYTLRLAPPLTIKEDDLAWALEEIVTAISP